MPSARAGNATSARGAASLVAEAVSTARGCGAAGEVVVRMDSAFYSRKVLWAARRGGARFSVTARADARVQAACQTIPEHKWVDIKYPRAVWDEDEQRWISDAQIAETTYTAFESTRQAITARLIVRRVKRLDSQQTPGQQELFTAYRYHAVFTDSPFILTQAEAHHRGHAVIEQVNADLINGPLAHLPSGHFAANAAWLTLAAIAHNLTRAAATLASSALSKARGATIRTPIINVAARGSQPRPPPHPAPSPTVALAAALGQPVHRHPPATGLTIHIPRKTRRPAPATPRYPQTSNRTSR